MRLLERIAALFGAGARGSQTAQRVAALRAGFDRPHTPDGDPDAQRRMCRGMRTALAPGLQAHLLARTRFFDQAVLAAIERGVEQAVVVGAGYDDRALRFRSPGLRFFELDHPTTQADKLRRLRAIEARTDQLSLIAADFHEDDIASALRRGGHDPVRPTLFLCEGLLVYLKRDAIVELLAALAARASTRSRLAVSLAVHAPGLDSSSVAASANARRRLGRSEPWLTILPLGSHLELLHEGNWIESEVLDQHALEPRARPGSSVFVTAHPI